MAYIQVAIHELKAGLSRFVAEAGTGALIEITSHGKPVARLTGLPSLPPTGLARVVAEGLVTWSGRKPAFDAPVKLSSGGTALSRMVAEDRV